MDLTTWEGRIEWEIGRGLTYDEIVDAFDHQYVHGGPVFTRAGEQLEWGTLHGRRRILPLIERLSGSSPIAATPIQPSGPEWREIVRAYRAVGKPRPSQLEVAERMGFQGEQPLRDRLRPLGVTDWRAVHALMAGEPD